MASLMGLFDWKNSQQRHHTETHRVPRRVSLWSMVSCFSSSRQEEFLHIKLHVFEFELYVWDTPIALGSRLHVSHFTGKVAEEKSSILVKVTQENQGIQNSSSPQQPSVSFAFWGVHVHLWACMYTPCPPMCWIILEMWHNLVWELAAFTQQNNKSREINLATVLVSFPL